MRFGLANEMQPPTLEYLGVRSEIDAYMSDSGPYASSPVQREVGLIRGG